MIRVDTKSQTSATSGRSCKLIFVQQIFQAFIAGNNDVIV